jgi:hypothetical protein
MYCRKREGVTRGGSLEHFVKIVISPNCLFSQSSFLEVCHFGDEEGGGGEGREGGGAKC